MNKYIVLYNPKAGNKTAEKESRKLVETFSGNVVEFKNILEITDYKSFFETIGEDTSIIIAGGDGTLNRFVNNLGDSFPENDILYYPAGSGNDFMNDLGKKKGCEPFSIKKYLQKLPRVLINEKIYRFINGVGYGIDGYCCLEGEKMRKKTKKAINYTKIAIKSILFKYKPTKAKVTVDGKEYEFKHVWMAPTMNGRYCGGGMMATPMQDRNEDDISVLIACAKSKFRLLTILPTIFEGKHVKFEKHIHFIKGKCVTVEFDRPVPAQIDGEAIENVKKYQIFSYEKIPQITV